MADGAGIVGAVNADALFVKRNPHHAHGIPRPQREEVKISAAFAVSEHFLIPTKGSFAPGARPFPNGRGGMREPTATGYAGISRLRTPEHVRFRVDFYGDIPWRSTFARSWRLGFGSIFNFIRRLRGSFAAGLNVFYRSDFERFNIRDHELIAGFDLFQFVGVEMLEQMNVALKFIGDGGGIIWVGEELLRSGATFDFALSSGGASGCSPRDWRYSASAFQVNSL
jgi:hypothetical protein